MTYYRIIIKILKNYYIYYKIFHGRVCSFNYFNYINFEYFYVSGPSDYMESDSVKIDDGNERINKKRKRRQVKYNKDWESTFPWFESVPNDSSRANCKFCTQKIKIEYCRKAQPISHNNSKLHLDNRKSAINFSSIS